MYNAERMAGRSALTRGGYCRPQETPAYRRRRRRGMELHMCYPAEEGRRHAFSHAPRELRQRQDLRMNQPFPENSSGVTISGGS